MDDHLRRRLFDMLERDTQARQRAAIQGGLFEGYNDALRDVYNANARELAEIVDQGGWPDKYRVGEDGATVAFLVVQHAIGLPNFMRACLELIEEAAERGAVPRWHVAFLMDRICVMEGKPQVYGSQFDWDAAGEVNPLPIEAPETVDQRRKAIDLVPMADAIVIERKEKAARGEMPPSNWAKRQTEFDAWAQAVGWR
ncbi:DUF6624 domain-containing protein [Ferrovibrio sp.]|uniref:DUF6624 domain-containing protein n=1 Tax=Ferrovibrio sp. TaxID=1917215 RepID=UPI003D0DFE7E